eukprot:scaffold918_cov126-Cylindrotheca_fusiformis.AAC.63
MLIDYETSSSTLLVENCVLIFTSAALAIQAVTTLGCSWETPCERNFSRGSRPTRGEKCLPPRKGKLYTIAPSRFAMDQRCPGEFIGAFLWDVDQNDLRCCHLSMETYDKLECQPPTKLEGTSVFHPCIKVQCDGGFVTCSTETLV